ncbi:uncharacterized protein LOC143857257 isoform X3 [Tasmannia lanceolata]|uniref:uncharacterized protein LOC143857257 isoform X3 n=1 Tax=Tasmannia lanceolata TaxID=3420 RepID=UPI0040635A72
MYYTLNMARGRREPKPFICDCCKRSFPTKNAVEQHINDIQLSVPSVTTNSSINKIWKNFWIGKGVDQSSSKAVGEADYSSVSQVLGVEQFPFLGVCFVEPHVKGTTLYLEKCGASSLEDAGYCFTRCWSLAVMAVNSLELEVLTENIYLIKGRLTHVEIRRVVMLLFMSRMVPDELYQSISNHFVQIAPWKHFIEPLNENMESGSGHISLVSSKLQAALKCTFNINWKEKVGCISPHCYVYIAERLLFLVSSCQGYFFRTRSSCAERLRFQEANLVTCLVTDAIGHNSLIAAFDSVVEMVKNAMLNRNETLGWIRRSKINAADQFPLLVLRLMVMISLAYLNTGRNFGLLASKSSDKD